MRYTAPAAAILLAGAVLPGLAAADEFTDTINSALEAYAEGDITIAAEELDYATKLLNGMRAEALGRFLPAPPPGWTRSADADDAEGAGMAMAMFGGGTTAAATYTKGDQDVTITLVANSPMVTGIGAMLGGIASMGGEGKPIRIQRTQFMMSDGDLQGVVDDKVMVSVSGSADLEDKKAFLEAMDLKALGDF